MLLVLTKKKILYEFFCYTMWDRKKSSLEALVLPILFQSFVITFPGIKLSSQKAPLSVLLLLKRLTTKFGMVWCGSDLVKTPGFFYSINLKIKKYVI